MFDKMQSTYFKRVTTGVLALFMTASSGFSYAVPVYAEEVTTAAAKRKKEEEFSSTESSTLTLRENDKKNEAEGSNTTETDGIKVTTNGSSDVQPEVKIEKPDNKKEPGRKLSSKKAQEDLKEMIQNKKYSYQDILQRIFEIDDFTFYSKLTLDEIKFLMSGTTEEKYEIAELLMYKSVYLYADYNITSEDFYSELSQYFQFLDECNVDLKDEKIEKIEKQLLLDINIYYVGDENLYQKDLDEYLTHIIETTSKGKQDICKKYIEEMHKYIFSNKTDRNRNNIRAVFGLKEEAKSEKETASEAIKKKAEDFSITEGSPLRKYSNQKYSSNTAFRDGCVFVYIKDSDTGLTTTGKLTVSRNNNVSWNYMQANTTWWNCKLDIISEKNYHNLSLRSPTVSTDLDAGSKDANGEYSKFIINIYLQYTQHAHHKVSNISYDAADAGRLNFNKYSQFDNAGGSIPWNLEHADTDQKDVNLQINTAQLGLRTMNKHRYCGTSATITYSRPDYTVRYYDKVNPNPIDTKIVSDGNTANTGGIPNDPSRDGYRFTGWKNHEGQSPWDKTICGADENFYAQWVSSDSTLSIDPNGGTYKGSSGVTTVNHLSPGATITVDSPTRPGYKFAGWVAPNVRQSWSNNGWTNSVGTDPNSGATHSQSYVDWDDRNTDSHYYTVHKWTGISSPSDSTWNHLEYPTYTAKAGHTYRITGQIKIVKKPSGGYSQLNLYHGAYCNDWENCKANVGETGKWVDFSMDRTFDTTTSNARFEIFTSDLKGLSGDFEFYVQGLKTVDLTTGNEVSMSKVEMGDNDATLTARWIPLHSTLSYDAQGGSLDSVKSTDNPNNYKIVDNGDYFIQSGLNSSRYLHDYDCSAENGAKVCTFQGYGANAKQCIWTFERYKNTPYYYIINKYNGKALNLSGDGPGTRDGSVEMWTQLDGSNAAQSDFLWYFKDAGDGYITICNKLTDKALDIPNGEDNDNVKLQQYTPNGTASQKFKLVQSEDNYVTTSVVYNGKYLTATGSSNSTECAFTDKKILWKVRRRGRERYFENEYSDTYTLEDTTTGLKLNAVYYNGRYIIFNNQYDELCYNNGNLWMEYDDDEKDQYSISVQLADADPSSLPSSNISMTLADFPTREKYTDSNVYINSATPVKKGCKFLGWNTKEDGSGKTYQPGDLYDVNQDGGNATLYAQWEKAKYNINVKLNGGTLNDGTYNSLKDFSIVKYAGDKFNIGIPTKEKNNFLGWTPNTLNGDAPTDFTANKSGTMVTSKHKEQTGTYESGYDQNSSQALYVDGAIWNNVQNTSSTSKYNTVQSGKMKLKAGHTYKVMGGLIVKGLTDSSGNSIAANVNLRLRSNSNQKVSESDCTKISSNGTSCRPSFEITPKSDIDDATFEISVEIPSGTKATRLLLTYEFGIVDTTTGVEGVGTEAEGTMGEGNFTLTAQWAPWKHTVRYDANAKNDTSVKGIPASQSKTANVDIKLNSGVPTRNGYTFLGWNTKADGKGTAYAAGAIYKNDQNGGTVTLYAQWTPWKHVLHYNKNVPTSSTSQTVSNMPVDQTKTFGQLMTISNLVPTRKGYTFAGWYTQSNGTGTKYDPGSNYAADQNGGTVNLYAKWTPWTYNIKYDQNVKSTSSSKTVTDMPNAQTKTQEIDVTLSSMTPKRNGYIFAGWSTSANGSVEYKQGSRFTKDLDSNGASITLYAVWTPWKHTVHYNSNIPTNAPTGTTTVSNMPGDQTKTFDEKLMISSNKPTRKGYNFAGWSRSANGDVVYQPGAEYKNDQNGGTVTLYAKWTAWKHTVTYDKNVPANSKKTDVKNMPGNQTKIYDQNLTLQSNVPTRIGYTFVKWTTNKDGTGTAYQPGSQYSYNRDSDGGTVTLYAVWTPWKYTVRYDKNVPASSSSQTVSNMPADQTKTEEVNLTLSSNKPSRNGYIFNGWQAQINGKAVDYQPGAKLSYDVDDKDGSTIILKAQWTPWKHTVHYDKNVPANSSSQTVTNMPEDQTKTFDEKLNLSTKIPKREGYNFVGWLLEYGTAIAVVSPGTAYERDQNGGTYVLKAQWEPWKHTVHYDANGGDQSSVPNDQKKTYEQNMNVATKVPTRNEYKFLGWKAYHEYNDKSGNKHSELIGNYQPGASYNYDIDETGQYAADNGEYNKCGTVTMKAQWVQLYTVKYDGNQPAIKGVTVTGSVANQTQGQDESVNLRTNNFKNDSGVYKNWSVGKDAYKYGKLDGKIREFIHPEGFKTNHSTMQNEYTGYEGQIKLIHS